MSGRIGKVRMKETGFEFRVIPGVESPTDDFGATMIRHAREIATAESVAGFIILGVSEDGGYRCGFRWDDARSPMPRTLVPSYVAEVLRRELITDVSAETVFDQKFEWVE